jgi:hypothetical protein
MRRFGAFPPPPDSGSPDEEHAPQFAIPRSAPKTIGTWLAREWQIVVAIVVVILCVVILARSGVFAPQPPVPPSPHPAAAQAAQGPTATPDPTITPTQQPATTPDPTAIPGVVAADPVLTIACLTTGAVCSLKAGSLFLGSGPAGPGQTPVRFCRLDHDTGTWVWPNEVEDACRLTETGYLCFDFQGSTVKQPAGYTVEVTAPGAECGGH